MTQFRLKLQFEAENVSAVSRTPSQHYVVNATCSKCGSSFSQVTLSPEETVQIPNSRGTASLVIQCQYCSNRSSVNFLKEQKAQQSGDLVAIIEVRGSFQPLNFGLTGWRAESSGGAVFDCYQAELAEWDDDIQADVMCYGLSGVVE